MLSLSGAVVVCSAMLFSFFIIDSNSEMLNPFVKILAVWAVCNCAVKAVRPAAAAEDD